MKPEKDKAISEREHLKTRLEELEFQKAKIEQMFTNSTAQEFINGTIRHFDKKAPIEQRRIIQTLIPEVILHEDKRLELRINPDPLGCHSGGEKVRPRGKWRG